MTPRSLTILFCVFVACGGCRGTHSSTSVTSTPGVVTDSNTVTDNDAITAAIEKHLRDSSGINMAVMDMTVNAVNVTGDQAQADAEFHLKQGGTPMLITYRLERHAGRWIVLSNQPIGGHFAHPPMDETHFGAAGNPSTQTLPDVDEFLKNHPPNAKTSP